MKSSMVTLGVFLLFNGLKMNDDVLVSISLFCLVLKAEAIVTFNLFKQ